MTFFKYEKQHVEWNENRYQQLNTVIAFASFNWPHISLTITLVSFQNQED